MTDPVRRRHIKDRSKGDTGIGSQSSSSSDRLSAPKQAVSALDIFRILCTLVALTLSLSYYLTSGQSLAFGYRPWFTRADRLKAYVVCDGRSLSACLVFVFPTLGPCLDSF